MEELKATGKTHAKNYDLATVLFADFADFTGITEEMPPEELVSSIDEYFQMMDHIVTKHKVEKIKTVGDDPELPWAAPRVYVPSGPASLKAPHLQFFAERVRRPS